jgi:hypothetical protein
MAELTGGVPIRRTALGWQVGDEPTETASDLLTAMVLADLMAGDLEPGARPPRPSEPMDEVGRLKLAIHQLEHALAARVVVEQAIGVLAERLVSAPRDAFELLRKVARSRGMRVHDLSRSVVASVTDPTVTLPAELPPSRR